MGATSFNTLLVHDTEYVMSPAYTSGADAMRRQVPYGCNPHRAGSAAHDAWNSGHENESSGEHFRFGKDLLVEADRGQAFDMDPAVPRIGGADPEDAWVEERRAHFERVRLGEQPAAATASPISARARPRR